MRRILKIDEANRIAVVQPGVVNLHVSRAVAHLGLHYVPDPSSQPTCTIGGNIAENAGGIHCLKYGTTTDHVLGLRVVLAGGEVVELGGGGTRTARLRSARRRSSVQKERLESPPKRLCAWRQFLRRCERCWRSLPKSTTPATRSRRSSPRA